MPDRMPEDMPDKMPEDMSDRMPEDLPVTKRIDVMVGITQSKVINCFRNLVCSLLFCATNSKDHRERAWWSPAVCPEQVPGCTKCATFTINSCVELLFCIHDLGCPWTLCSGKSCCHLRSIVDGINMVWYNSSQAHKLGAIPSFTVIHAIPKLVEQTLYRTHSRNFIKHHHMREII